MTSDVNTTFEEIKRTKRQLNANDLELLYRALQGAVDVLFAGKGKTPDSIFVLPVITGPYKRVSDPGNTSVCPIACHNFAGELIEIAFGVTGEIVTRKSQREMRANGGWEQPEKGVKVYAFVPKDFR